MGQEKKISGHHVWLLTTYYIFELRQAGKIRTADDVFSLSQLPMLKHGFVRDQYNSREFGQISSTYGRAFAEKERGLWESLFCDPDAEFTVVEGEDILCTAPCHVRTGQSYASNLSCDQPPIDKDLEMISGMGIEDRPYKSQELLRLALDFMARQELE